MHINMVIFVDQNIWFPSGTIIASCCTNFSQYLATIASLRFCNRATLWHTIWLTNQCHQIFTFFNRFYIICACSSSSYDSSSTCTRPWISKFTSFIQWYFTQIWIKYPIYISHNACSKITSSTTNNGRVDLTGRKFGFQFVGWGRQTYMDENAKNQ